MKCRDCSARAAVVPVLEIRSLTARPLGTITVGQGPLCYPCASRGALAPHALMTESEWAMVLERFAAGPNPARTATRIREWALLPSVLGMPAGGPA